MAVLFSEPGTIALPIIFSTQLFVCQYLSKGTSQEVAANILQIVIIQPAVVVQVATRSQITKKALSQRHFQHHERCSFPSAFSYKYECLISDGCKKNFHRYMYLRNRI